MNAPLPQTEYTIESKSSWPIKVFEIFGNNGDAYTFNLGTYCSPTLGMLNDSNGSELVEFHLSNGSYILELSGFRTALSRLRLKYYYNSGYTIVGKLGTVDFNWEWRHESYFGSKYTLVDITNENQILAVITATACRCKLGSVLVSNGVPSDFHKVIISFVAFMWRFRE